MPARPSVPNVTQIVLTFDIGSDTDVINRFFQKYSGTAGSLTDTQTLAIATGTGTAWAAHMASLINNNVTLKQIGVTDLSSDLGSEAIFLSSAAGTDSGSQLSAGAAAVIKAKIDRRYRGGHPRTYIGGISNAHLTNPQQLDPTYLQNLVTAWTAFRVAVAALYPSGTLPVTDVNVSWYQGFTNHTFPSGRVRPIPNYRPTPVVDQIASFSANPNIGSQRRRNKQSL